MLRIPPPPLVRPRRRVSAFLCPRILHRTSHYLPAQELPPSLPSSQVCFIGQPVALQPTAKNPLSVIRVAASAPLVSWIYEYSKLGDELHDTAREMLRHSTTHTSQDPLDIALARAHFSDLVLLQKLVMILENWEQVKDV